MNGWTVRPLTESDDGDPWPFTRKPIRAVWMLFWLGAWIGAGNRGRSQYDPRELLPTLWNFARLLWLWKRHGGPGKAMRLLLNGRPVEQVDDHA